MSKETIDNILFIKKRLLQDVSQDEQIQVVLLILSYVNNKNISNEIIIDPKYLQVLLTLLTTGSAEMPIIINLIDPILNSNVDQQNNLADNLIKLSKYVPLVQKISDINKTNISKMNILSQEKRGILLMKLIEIYKSGALSNIKRDRDINKYTSLLPILYFLPFVQFINDDSMKKTIVSNIIKKLLNISNESQYIDEQPNNIDEQPTNNATTNEIFKIILNEVKTSLGENQFEIFRQSTNNLEKSSGYLEGERIRLAKNLEDYKNKLGTLTLNKFNDNVENIGIYMENTIYQQVLNIMKIINPNPTPPAPVITLNGDDKVEVKIGGKYEELGATATDNQGKKLEKVKITGDVNTSKEDSYTVTYTATDGVGNTSTVKRTVIVFVPPTITLNGDDNVQVKIREKYEELGANATDSKGKKLDVKITGDVVTSKKNSYTVTYSATDSEGHTSTITRTVIVFVPPPPVITLSGLNPLVINFTTKLIFEIALVDLRASAKDYNGNDISVESDAENKREYVLKNGQGEYLVTYSATDDVGNTSTATRRLQVINFSLYGDSFVDQSNENGNYWSGTTDQWQSFTPSKNGLLEKIEMYITSPTQPSTAPIVMRLYEGEGTSGVLLAESSGLISPGADRNWVALDNIYIDVKTQKYTIRITTPSSPVGWINVSDKRYNGGRSSLTGNDCIFRTYMLTRK
jgi:hypothetical protein